MIRAFQSADMEAVLDIWLNASIQAHHFIAASYWQSQLDNMRRQYLPAAENYVYVEDEQVLGFYSLVDNCLAAIFVQPQHQGRGIGTQLLNHAKNKRSELFLNVYQANLASVAFYQAQGFVIRHSGLDEATNSAEYCMHYSS